MNEDQESVSIWGKKYYPGESRNQMLKGLVEEVAELSIAMGDIAQDEMKDVIEQTWSKLGHDRGNKIHISSGLADVQICLFAIGSELGMNVQEALDYKMEMNRKNKP